VWIAKGILFAPAASHMRSKRGSSTFNTCGGHVSRGPRTQSLRTLTPRAPSLSLELAVVSLNFWVWSIRENHYHRPRLVEVDDPRLDLMWESGRPANKNSRRYSTPPIRGLSSCRSPTSTSFLKSSTRFRIGLSMGRIFHPTATAGSSFLSHPRHSRTQVIVLHRG